MRPRKVPTFVSIIKYWITMEKKKGLLSKIFSNTRKPEGFFGRLMVAGMNGGSHAAMAKWGLEIIDIPQTGEILDIGCGGGANIARLLARSKEAKVTAFETVYFWPDIEKSFAGVRRILADGGTFLIVNEDDGLSGNNGKWEKIIDGMHTYTPDELKTHLTIAGFKQVEIHRDKKSHWLAVTAVKC